MVVKLYGLYDNGREIARGSSAELAEQFDLSRNYVTIANLHNTRVKGYDVKELGKTEKKVYQYVVTKNYEIFFKGTRLQVKNALHCTDEELFKAVKSKTSFNGYKVEKYLVYRDKLETFNVRDIIKVDEVYERILDHLQTYRNTIMSYSHKDKLEEYKQKLKEDGIEATFTKRKDEYGVYYYVEWKR